MTPQLLLPDTLVERVLTNKSEPAVVALGNGLGRAHCRWLLQGRDRGVPDGSFAGQGSERLERRGEYEGRVEDLAGGN